MKRYITTSHHLEHEGYRLFGTLKFYRAEGVKITIKRLSSAALAVSVSTAASAVKLASWLGERNVPHLICRRLDAWREGLSSISVPPYVPLNEDINDATKIVFLIEVLEGGLDAYCEE